jgi:hypothetical protein
VTSPKEARYHPWVYACGFSYMPPAGLHALISQCDHHSFRVPPSVMTQLQWYRNINLSSIDYAFRPRLRVRLTLGGFTGPRNPWVYGEQDSHLLYRYLFRHNHFQDIEVSLPSPFTCLERSPTRATNQRSVAIRSFGCTLEPRSFSAQNLSTSELLRTL